MGFIDFIELLWKVFHRITKIHTIWLRYSPCVDFFLIYYNFLQAKWRGAHFKLDTAWDVLM